MALPAPAVPTLDGNPAAPAAMLVDGRTVRPAAPADPLRGRDRHPAQTTPA